MKFYKVISVLAFFSFFKLNAQTIQLTQVALTTYSSFQSFSGKIEISDSFLVFTTYTINDSGKDSTVEKERILKKKNGYVKTQVPKGANNYE